jgi:hypothetical protein
MNMNRAAVSRLYEPVPRCLKPSCGRIVNEWLRGKTDKTGEVTVQQSTTATLLGLFWA